MALLVADCPRCGATKITFDISSQNLAGLKYGGQYEIFCICRHCQRSTVFVVRVTSSQIARQGSLAAMAGSVNGVVDINGYISLKDCTSIDPPEHLPPMISPVFEEGARCLAVGCFNAAGTMFRLCVDLATKSLLPEANDHGLNSTIRRSLGLRLPWLFDHDFLPESMRELSSCIKEDGNDGAHVGSLSKEDAEDLADFTISLLERLYTEPEKLRIAQERRDARRSALAN